MSRYIGDFAEDFATLEFTFTSRRFSTGAPFTLAGTPSLAVYATGSTTQSTAGVTLTVDYDSVTGLNHVLIDLSADAFYATGKDYEVVIAAGTVDSISVVGEVLAKFSIQNRYKGVDVQSIATNAISAAAVSAAAANKIADHTRRRTQANVEASSDGDAISIGSLYGLIQQGQESNTEDNAGFLTVYRTDGTTELAQRALTTDAGAVPVTGIS